MVEADYDAINAMSKSNSFTKKDDKKTGFEYFRYPVMLHGYIFSDDYILSNIDVENHLRDNQFTLNE